MTPHTKIRHSRQTAALRALSGLCALCLLTTSWAQKETPPNEDVVKLEPFSVEAAVDASGYGVTSASSLTRTNTPLRDIPQTINIATDKMISELAAESLGEALILLPGVNPRGGGPDQFSIRFIDTFSSFRNNFRLSVGEAGGYRRDLSNVARVEVIKGLGSTATGRGEAGGVINVVTKKPQAKKENSVKFTMGSWGYYKVEADSTGAISDDGKIRYRAIAAYTGGETYLDNASYDVWAFYPSLEFLLGENTNLLLEGSLQTGRTPTTQFFEIQDERQYFVRLPDNSYIRNFPQDGALQIVKVLDQQTPQIADFVKPDAQVYDLTTTLTHRFSDWFSTRQALLLYKADVDEDDSRLRGFGSYIFDPNDPLGPPIDWTMAMRYDKVHTETELVSLQGDFLFDYSFGDFVNNQTLVGYEYTTRDQFKYSTRSQTGGIFRILDNANSLNVSNVTEADLPPPSVREHTDRSVTEWAYFVQHTSKFFNDRVLLTGAWRYDGQKEDLTDLRSNTLTKLRPEDTDGTWRLGASVKVRKGITVFGVHAEQANPTETVFRYPDGTFGVPGRDPNELISSNRTFELDEVGIKAELANGRYTFNLTHYNITLNSGIRSVNFRLNPNDELDPLYNYRENVIDPSQTSSGYEIELMGAPSDRFSFYASAALPKSSSDTVQADGSLAKRKLRGHTDVALSFLGNYLVGQFKKWDVYGQTAMGYTDDVILNPENRFLQSGSFRWDLGIRVQRVINGRTWEAQARVENVLDQRITTGTANSGSAPRRFSFYVRTIF
ncbi:MAG: TonB-dependent receptor plug domain-containing protein [Opitutaceae bacterium]|nr:TonB-dependent receptor plug domain-containing protein [Opitutaceae bacterium]